MQGKSDSFKDRVHSAKKGNPIWKLEPDACLVGIFLGIRVVKIKGEDRGIIDVHDEEKDIDVSIWGTTVLSREIEEQKIQTGERIGLHYLGNEKGYHDFVVMVDREEK